MRISFQHANPQAGNESFLLRFDVGESTSPCILVDAGYGVDLTELLGPRDRLVAICLTHAHLDHYAEVAAAHSDGVQILTSPATATIMADVFEVADREYDVRSTDAVRESITAIDDWTTVADGIDVHPVPAGHVPGAVGFLIRAREDGRSHHLLATGDFTRRRAGGFPGFDADGFVDVDALFLTAATNDEFEPTLTDALGTALERAQGGAPTLVATSGLVGVQCAYLLSNLVGEFDLAVPIRVIGHVAKLYEALDYECAGVETTTVFAHTDECIERGGIVIAGPEIPHERSSGRLFGVLREDPSACVVQLVGSGRDPMTDAKCTVHAHELVNHPTRETIVEVHDLVDPTQTVIVHQHGGVKGAFNDLSSTVWGAGDTAEYTLYDGHQWQLPPWMDGGGFRRDEGRSVGELVGTELLDSLSLPTLDRHGQPDLEAEGIVVERLERILHRGPGAASGPDAPVQDYDEPDREPAHSTVPTMTTDGSDSTDSGESTDEARRPSGLVRTTGQNLGDGLDPHLETALEEGTITEEDLSRVSELSQLVHELDGEAASDDDSSKDGDELDPEPGRADQPATDSEGEDTDALSGSAGPESDRAAPEGPADSGSDPDADAPSGAVGDTEAADEGDLPSPGGDDDGAADAITEPQADVEGQSMTLELDPFAVALAERTLSSDDDGDARSGDIDEWIAGAVDEYVVALLAGEATGGEHDRFAVDLGGSEAVDRAIDDVLDEEEFDSVSELLAQGLAASLGIEVSTEREIPGLPDSEDHLEAIVANEEFAFSGIEGIVEAAIARRVASN